MTQLLAKNLLSSLQFRGRIFIVLLISILIVASYYVYLVHSVIVSVVERETIVKDIRIKSTAISELEASYFLVKNNINIELAHAKGFEDAEVSSFISKKSLTAFVSHNEL